MEVIPHYVPPQQDTPSSKSDEILPRTVASSYTSQIPSSHPPGDVTPTTQEITVNATVTFPNSCSTVPNSQSLNLRLAPPQKSQAEALSSVEKPKKSPVRPQPTRRSVTPTPSSDFVQFFPCFSMGSGGSPPLMATPKFDFPDETPKANEKTSQLLNNAVPVSVAYFPVPTSTSAPSSQVANAVVLDTRSNTDTQSITGDAASAAVVSRRNSEQSIPTAPVTDLSSASPSKTVIVTSFSGYEVKVKYLNSSAPSAASMKAYQARIPMKKRPVNVSSFSTQPVEIPRSRSETTHQPSTASSELKMTSLYVGASASFLDSSSNTAPASTSDHESDRESSFVDHKKNKYPHHWRKNLLHVQTNREAIENKQKSIEKIPKKRTFQVHQYEGPEAKTSTNAAKSQTEAKRKAATFNLWDRKHHASK